MGKLGALAAVLLLCTAAVAGAGTSVTGVAAAGNDDTDDGDNDDDDPASFEVTDAETDASTVDPGDAVDVTATLSNTGDEDGEFTAELQIDGETVRTEAYELEGGESTEISFSYAFDEAGEYEVSVSGTSAGTVTVREPAHFEVRSIDVPESTVVAGERVPITVTVANTGDVAGEYDIDLAADGIKIAFETVTADGGETATTTFYRSFDEPGTYTLTANGQAATELTVGEPAEFEVRSADLSSTSVSPGESVGVTATVENTGDVSGEFDAKLQVDRDTTDTRTVALDGGESTTVQFTTAFDETGGYEVAVSGTEAGTITVTEPAEFVVRNRTLDPTTVVEGESVEVTATVENTGGAAGSYEVPVSVGGEEVASREVRLESGESTTVNVDYGFEDAGEYAVAVDGERAGTVTVQAPANIAVAAVDLNESRIGTGEPVAATTRVVNQGDTRGTETLQFRVDGEPIKSESVTLDGGETDTIRFVERFDDAGVYALAVGDEFGGRVLVVPSADVTVRDATLGRDRITEGEAVEVTATLANTGGRAGRFTAELQVDGETVDTDTVTVPPDETRTVSFERTFDESGDYEVAVSGTSAGSLDVVEPAAFEVRSVEPAASSVSPGESVTVTATVANVGGERGRYTAELRVDDETRSSKPITVAAGETRTVEFAPAFEEAGEYGLSVGDASATVTVVEPAAFEVRAPELSDERIVAGESVTVSAAVSNEGGQAGQFTAELQIDGTGVNTTTVTVPPGQTRRVSFEPTLTEVGNRELEISDADAGSVEVVEPADFEVTEADLNETDVVAGDPVGVTATVENEGSRSGTTVLELQVGDEVLASQSVTVDGGDSESVTFSPTAPAPGEYGVTVGDATAGTLDVVEPADFEVLGVELNASSVLVDEPVAITVRARNTGGVTGRTNVTVTATGQSLTTRTLSAEPGSVGTVTVTTAFDEPGRYDIRADGEGNATVTVGQPASFETTGVTANETEVTVGEPVRVNATVENTGDRAGTWTGQLRANGTTLDRQTRSLTPGERTTVTFGYVFETAGRYPVSVEGVDGPTVEVAQADPFEVSETSLNASTVAEGEAVAVTATVRNSGEPWAFDSNDSRTTTVGLRVDGDGVRERRVGPLAAGDTGSVTFEYVFDERGNYSLSVDGVSAGSVNVEAPESDDSDGTSGGDDSGGSSGGAPAGGGGNDGSNNNGSPSGSDDGGDDSGSAPTGGGSGDGGQSAGNDGGSSDDGNDGNTGNSDTTDSESVAGGASGEPDNAGTDTGESDQSQRLTRVERGDSVLLAVQNDAGERTVREPVGVSTGDGGVRLTAVELGLDAGPSQFNATFTGASAVPDTLGPGPNGTTLGYVGVQVDGNGTVGQVQYVFEPRDQSESLQVYQRTNGSWVALATSEGENGTLRATASRLGSVAVVAPAADRGPVQRVAVASATVPADWVRTGYNATVRATVANPADRNATDTLVVAVNGDRVTSRRVTLGPGERRTVRIEFPATAGNVTLNGADAGTIQVGQPTANTETTTGGGGPGFGVATLVVVLLVAGWLARRH